LNKQKHVEIGEQGSILGVDVALLQQWDNVDIMRKSNILPLNFEASLLRDESKNISVIFKSLPEYADVKAVIEIEYQGESVEVIFCTETT
jgi:hypothetical protein